MAQQLGDFVALKDLRYSVAKVHVDRDQTFDAPNYSGALHPVCRTAQFLLDQRYAAATCHLRSFDRDHKYCPLGKRIERKLSGSWDVWDVGGQVARVLQSDEIVEGFKLLSEARSSAGRTELP